MGQHLLPEGAAPSTPAAGYVAVYAKTDGLLYSKDDAGVETVVTSVLGANVGTFLATPSSANLAAALTDETGSGAAVFGTAPTLTNATINAASNGDAITVTNTGTGNCLVVNDVAGDTTPFVIDANGRIIQGYSGSISLDQPAYMQNHSASGQAQFRWVNDVNGTYTYYARSRSPTIGSFSPLTVNDIISYHRFYGDDGVAFVEAARVSVAVDTTVSTGVMPGRYIISTVSETGVMTEAIRVDSSQRTLLKAAHAVSATFANPANGSTVTLTNSISHYQRTGSGTASSLTINLPANPVHGQVVSVGSRGDITALTVGSAGADAITDAPTTLAAGGYFEMIYLPGSATWFRKG